ncbi:N-acetyltransferase family protein [Saccharopolyspora taberi]|uniref:GNAT family N-acetyltransferase n=1 Tax=Saccharopolyspora taberi TaxID=60895 RepID=A0ABN3V8G6_9PSEU
MALIRPAGPGDLDQVEEIYAHYVTTSVATFELEPPGPDDWRERHANITTGGLPFLVAEDGGEVLGYAYCSPWRTRPAYRHTVENTVYLAPSATGRGLGRALLEELLAECARTGVREVIAVIADSGDPASVRLHERCGFTPAGRLSRVGRKHGRWLDTLLYQRSLA